MRHVLIVSPHFPPTSSPDMQRVRMSLPFLRELGWRPTVLGLRPSEAGRPTDPALGRAVPEGTRVVRVEPAGNGWLPPLGISNPTLRALPRLYRAGARVLRADCELVFFSTTMFWALPLARLWKRRFDVPVVVDLQDPWYNPGASALSGPKHSLAKRLHKLLEEWTMPGVDGLVAVSEAYVRQLRDRYPALARVPAETLPFGAPLDDRRLLDGTETEADRPALRPSDRIVGLYVGVAGRRMRASLDILFRTFRAARESHPDLFERVVLRFVGTDYSPPGTGVRSVVPLADEHRIAEHVVEDPERVPYSVSLRMLADADFLLMPGTDDPDYRPSKIHPYLLAERPIFAVLHEESAAFTEMNAVPGAHVVPLTPAPPGDGGTGGYPGRSGEPVEESVRGLKRVVELRDEAMPDLRDGLELFTARDMTERLCSLFDTVLEAEARGRR